MSAPTYPHTSSFSRFPSLVYPCSPRSLFVCLSVFSSSRMAPLPFRDGVHSKSAHGSPPCGRTRSRRGRSIVAPVTCAATDLTTTAPGSARAVLPRSSARSPFSLIVLLSWPQSLHVSKCFSLYLSLTASVSLCLCVCLSLFLARALSFYVSFNILCLFTILVFAFMFLSMSASVPLSFEAPPRLTLTGPASASLPVELTLLHAWVRRGTSVRL